MPHSLEARIELELDTKRPIQLGCLTPKTNRSSFKKKKKYMLTSVRCCVSTGKENGEEGQQGGLQPGEGPTGETDLERSNKHPGHEAVLEPELCS